jgi:hypothetical protein
MVSKWVEVPVTIMKTYAVEVEDSQGLKEAIGYVLEEIPGCDYEINESNCIVSEDDTMAHNIQVASDERLPL